MSGCQAPEAVGQSRRSQHRPYHVENGLELALDAPNCAIRSRATGPMNSRAPSARSSLKVSSQTSRPCSWDFTAAHHLSKATTNSERRFTR
ncbi:unnamed protein product [Heterosigma akashiwo]